MNVENPVFVFGSNLAGRHGKGAALFARENYGAVYGQGEGYQGNSYAIPTKGFRLEVLPLELIGWYVKRFLEFALRNYPMDFHVTAIGCGLAGYNPTDIAPFFANASSNVELCTEFRLALLKLAEHKEPKIPHGAGCKCFSCTRENPAFWNKESIKRIV